MQARALLYSELSPHKLFPFSLLMLAFAMFFEAVELSVTQGCVDIRLLCDMLKDEGVFIRWLHKISTTHNTTCPQCLWRLCYSLHHSIINSDQISIKVARPPCDWECTSDHCVPLYDLNTLYIKHVPDWWKKLIVVLLAALKGFN